jgi:hypothetical protein
MSRLHRHWAIAALVTLAAAATPAQAGRNCEANLPDT